MSEDTAHFFKELEESILIDFFLTVGLPAEIVAELLEEIEKQNKRDFEKQKAVAKENMDYKIRQINDSTEIQIKRQYDGPNQQANINELRKAQADSIAKVEQEYKDFKLGFSRPEIFDLCQQFLKNHKDVQDLSTKMLLNLYPDCINQGKMSNNDPRKNFIDKHKKSTFPKYAFPLGFRLKYQKEMPEHYLLPMAFVAGEDKVFCQYLIFYENLEKNLVEGYKLYDKVQFEIDNNNWDEDSEENMNPQDAMEDEDDKILEPQEKEEEKVSAIEAENAFNSNFQALQEERRMKKPSGTIPKKKHMSRFNQNEGDDKEINLEFEKFDKIQDTRHSIKKVRDKGPWDDEGISQKLWEDLQFKPQIKAEEEYNVQRNESYDYSRDGSLVCQTLPQTRAQSVVYGSDVITDNQIWVPKAICLVSVNPYYDFFSQILMDLYFVLITDNFEFNKEEEFLSKQQKQSFLIEQYVKKLVYGFCPKVPGATVQYQINSNVLLQHGAFGKTFDLSIPAVNELPYCNTRFMDRTFQLLKVEEVIALYTAIISEEKYILIISDNQFDLLAIQWTMIDLIYPLEWCLPMIPFIYADPENPTNQQFAMINHMQSIIIGIHCSAKEAIYDQIREETDNLQRLVIIDLTRNQQTQGFNDSQSYGGLTETSSVMGSISDTQGNNQYQSYKGAPHDSENEKLKQYRDFVSRMQGYPVSTIQDDQRESTVSQTERGSEANISVNTSNTQSSLITVTEGNWHEDTDYTELKEAEWKFEDEKQNNLQLPTKIRRDLKNSVIKCITTAKNRYFKNAQKLCILDEADQKFIRSQFYNMTCKFFQNYWNYLQDGVFDMDTFVQNEVKKENMQFFEALFKNNNWKPPDPSADSDAQVQKKFIVKQQLLQNFFQQSTSANKEDKYQHFMNTIISQMEPSSKNGLTPEQKKYAHDWLNQDLKLENQSDKSKPILVRNNEEASMNRFKGITFGDFFREIDHCIEAQIIDEIEENEFDVDAVKTADYKIHDFFCFKKSQEGFYVYHLFPKINESLLNNERLMRNYQDRSIYIKRIIPDMVQAQRRRIDNRTFPNGKGPRPPARFETEENIREMIHVYMTWIKLWCGTFSHQDEGEQAFRCNQLYQVLQKIKDPLNTTSQIEKSKFKNITSLILQTTSASNLKTQTRKLFQQCCKVFEEKNIHNIESLRMEYKLDDIVDDAEQEDNDSRISQFTKPYIDTSKADDSRQSTMLQTRETEITANTTTGVHDQTEKNKLKKLQEQLLIQMGSPIYKQLAHDLKMRQRTLLDKNDVTDKIIKDDSLQIQFRADCPKKECRGQLLGPKLKKAIQGMELRPHSTDLLHQLRCNFCGNVINPPSLKIIHGGMSQTFRNDRPKRHKEFSVTYLSYKQLIKMIENLITTKRGKLNKVDMSVFRSNDKTLYWNALYYFINHDLPYDMFLPYEDTKELDQHLNDFENKRSMRVYWRKDSVMELYYTMNTKKGNRASSQIQYAQ